MLLIENQFVNISLKKDLLSTLKRRSIHIRIILVAFLFSFSLWISRQSYANDTHVELTFNGTIRQSSWQAQIQNSKIVEQQSTYTPSLFIPEALALNNYKIVTAIVHCFTNDSSIEHVVNHLSKYPFIQEIHIYNQAGATPTNISIPVRYFDPHGRDSATSRFSLCAEATTDYCYFQDDQWLNPYMDTLYTNFLRNPDIVHATVDPGHYVDHVRWRFANTERQLHTGYVYLGFGSYVSKSAAQQFLSQLPLQNSHLSTVETADIFFSLWMNQYPWLLANPILPTQPQTDLFRNPDLHRALVISAFPNVILIFQPDPVFFSNPDVVHHRASCTNDRCIFTTDIDPMPNPQLLPFSTDNFTSLSHFEALYYESDVPTRNGWPLHAFHRAVDSNPTTCWHSYLRE
ncbi:uncharacterized protein BYT42DRAFT_495848 [Radiomyces spectabilis]|uniref:uncharacterized protein n=1 Tax=Radiomyces spectabilis TaxID=64574 RepID=UPI00221E53AE|nr:uncharacterized protein BYT42DRAFT_495848 [Radiomyces spectabilis]KAI8379133.1 hypothetical protein BYT42DRAFT_495848 [Radiomyces spectabilis]